MPRARPHHLRPAPHDPGTRNVLTPSALNRLVRDLLEDVLPMVWIEGELSNVARPGSGHIYFSLKDSGAQVRCAMFRGNTSALQFKPVDGAQVLLRARVGLYEPRGEFQLVVEHMEPAGEGALRREFDRLKAQLDAEGLFDAAHKRPLPRHAKRIGVITSATGAAIRDVISVLSRRWPLVNVDVLPVPVQGRDAPPAIVTMLERAAASARYDVLLLTRGGGSLEDLWAFNDETVARAVRASAVPIVCAVGHEVDFSIAEFAGDLRAATPSAAAELLVPDISSVRHHLSQLQQRLVTLQHRRLQTLQQRSDHLAQRLRQQRPQARLARDGERLAHLQQRMISALHARQQRLVHRLDRLHAHLAAQHPRQRFNTLRQRLAEQDRRMRQTMLQLIQRRQLQLTQTGRTLHAVSPLATLDRGYAIVFDPAGQVLRSASLVNEGDALRARLADGELALRVAPEA